MHNADGSRRRRHSRNHAHSWARANVSMMPSSATTMLSTERASQSLKLSRDVAFRSKSYAQVDASFFRLLGMAEGRSAPVVLSQCFRGGVPRCASTFRSSLICCHSGALSATPIASVAVLGPKAFCHFAATISGDTFESATVFTGNAGDGTDAPMQYAAKNKHSIADCDVTAKAKRS